MRVLVTGANGFLGRAVIHRLLLRGDMEVIGISRSNTDLPIRCYTLDILKAGKVEQVFQKHIFDVVIHLAALTAHSQIVDNKFEALDINLTGTKNLLQAFNAHCKNALFVYASTGKVYGVAEAVPITENTFPKPMNILGKSKYITEKVIDFYAQPDNQYLITRIFNIYGGRQKENFIVPTIVKQLKEGKQLHLGNITDQRDYLYVDDFVNAFVGCIDAKEQLGNFEIINIGSGIPTSVGDIIHAFERCLDIGIQIESDPGKFRKDEMPVEYCDNSKLKKLTGWNPQYSLDTAIDRICKEAGLK